jgi:hypothetical protein
VQARQVDGTGNPSQWQAATVTVDTVAPTPPVVNVVAGDDRIVLQFRQNDFGQHFA